MKYSFENCDINNFPDYYSILGLDSEASEDDIKEMYHKLISSFHPDKNKSKYATKQSQLVNEAYEILSDKNVKKKYDELLIQYFGQDENTEEHNVNIKSLEKIEQYIFYLNNYAENISKLIDMGIKGNAIKYDNEIERIYLTTRELRRFKRNKWELSNEILFDILDLISNFRADRDAIDYDSDDNQYILNDLENIEDTIYDKLPAQYREMYNQKTKKYNQRSKKIYKWNKIKCILNWMNEHIWSWFVIVILPIVVFTITCLFFKHII